MCAYCMCLFFSSHLWLFVCTFLGSTHATKILIYYDTIVFFSLLSYWSNALPSALFIFSYGIYSGFFSSNTDIFEQFCCILGEWQFSHTLARDREHNDFHKRWMGGNNLWWKFMVILCTTSTLHSQIRLVFIDDLLETMLRQYAVQ